ncbi:Ig-like domain-containing protein [Vibrio splendidus]|uniref:Ig-like domain-containing protein n=1 Tax=Vibrio splendidus TaxID=29497 RepID=UPI00076A72CC|nr:Ig-like domain-containing protein [Vibrio splendidus]
MYVFRRRLINLLLWCLLITVAITQFGCGGGSSGKDGANETQESEETVTPTLSARDASYSTEHADLFEVDLSKNVFSSNGRGFVLDDVEVLSDENKCHIEQMSATGFVIRAEDNKVCNYRYYVTPNKSSSSTRSHLKKSRVSNYEGSASSSSAIARVAVSNDPANTELIPISAVTLINESIEVSVQAELKKVGFDLGGQYVLTDVTLPYDYSSMVNISDSNSQTVEYAPPQGFTGIDRIMYTLEDKANGLVLMGVLDVAVGYEANQGFTIEQDIEYPDVINVNTKTDIDISQFVRSDDGDDYQIVYVESFNADVNAKDPLDTSNKTIVFETSRAGYHYISFAVSDHNGVYDMGLIRVHVADPNQVSKWGDISHFMDLYSAPLTAAEATANNVVYDSKLSDGAYTPAIDMAGFKYATGVDACTQIGGSIPTLKQLAQMASDIDVQVLHNWPIQAPYLAYDEENDVAKWVDLAHQVTGLVESGYAYNLTCLKQGIMQILPSSSKVVVANGSDTGTVLLELNRNGEAREGVPISVSVSSSNVTLDGDTITTDANGIARVELTSFKAEPVILTFEVEGVTENYAMEFIADEKTAQISSDVTVNHENYFSLEGDEVKTILKDQNDNPLKGYVVNSEVEAGVHPDTGMLVAPLLVGGDLKTDDSGEKKVRIKWDSSIETPKKDMTFDVTSSFTDSENNLIDSVSQVKFNAFVCGLPDDDDPHNAAEACLKVADLGSGVLMTATPSVPFLLAIGVTPPKVVAEDGSEGPAGNYAYLNYDQAQDLCETYNQLELLDRTNWELSSTKETSMLIAQHPDYLFKALGWPTQRVYVMRNLYSRDKVYLKSLGTSQLSVGGMGWPSYVSCVSY